jgi:hypothetical protein
VENKERPIWHRTGALKIIDMSQATITGRLATARKPPFDYLRHPKSLSFLLTAVIAGRAIARGH